jgi:hypothetical protein
MRRSHYVKNSGIMALVNELISIIVALEAGGSHRRRVASFTLRRIRMDIAMTIQTGEFGCNGVIVLFLLLSYIYMVTFSPV